MGGRKKLVIVTISVGILLVLTMAAVLFLPPLIAVMVFGVGAIFVLLIAGGPSRRRRDARDKALAEAAQRGDGAVFLGNRHDHTF